ncbi:hypothetical protein C427_1353 [Paraglaciecola psychrophila 170]|uniref:Uncharacterized protein n=1 Tax=Paraglaciecola psychrophila 170 TaxID=1129794 RepID=K7AT81_9ALTE|nr:hypothetical protein C427_1353 [Paraglaciecola psychrophila 170]GAC38440.1 hypothetical protein GPSY_2829 [Paraglaciecola psychrophila 170]
MLSSDASAAKAGAIKAQVPSAADTDKASLERVLVLINVLTDLIFIMGGNMNEQCESEMYF